MLLQRKQLQDLAKANGLKANAKSQVLAEQLQALRDGGAGAAATVPLPTGADEESLYSALKKRLSSVFDAVRGPSTQQQAPAEPPSTSHKRSREDFDPVDTIDEQAPLTSPTLDPARRVSKMQRLSTAANDVW